MTTTITRAATDAAAWPYCDTHTFTNTDTDVAAAAAVAAIAADDAAAACKTNAATGKQITR
eukprot:10874015-Alexandrium_andersonii.AAC.1